MIERKQKQIADTSFLLSKIQKRKGKFMEELKNTDKNGISTKRKIGMIIYEPIIISKQNNPSLVGPN